MTAPRLPIDDRERIVRAIVERHMPDRLDLDGLAARFGPARLDELSCMVSFRVEDGGTSLRALTVGEVADAVAALVTDERRRAIQGAVDVISYSLGILSGLSFPEFMEAVRRRAEESDESRARHGRHIDRLRRFATMTGCPPGHDMVEWMNVLRQQRDEARARVAELETGKAQLAELYTDRERQSGSWVDAWLGQRREVERLRAELAQALERVEAPAPETRPDEPPHGVCPPDWSSEDGRQHVWVGGPVEVHVHLDREEVDLSGLDELPFTDWEAAKDLADRLGTAIRWTRWRLSNDPPV